MRLEFGFGFSFNVGFNVSFGFGFGFGFESGFELGLERWLLGLLSGPVWTRQLAVIARERVNALSSGYSTSASACV